MTARKRKTVFVCQVEFDYEGDRVHMVTDSLKEAMEWIKMQPAPGPTEAYAVEAYVLGDPESQHVAWRFRGKKIDAAPEVKERYL